MAQPLRQRLAEAGIKVYEVSGRPKHLWSIYKKMQKRDKPYEEIYDLMAIRVLVENVPECYHALGVIHGGWTPLQERIKDYIASPKSNGYQSLHTTIFGPKQTLFEIQIRTREMHRTADYGIAAHWRYKEGGKERDDLDRALHWFRQVLELQLDAETPDQFLEFLKLDLYQDEIFVFTPKGDVHPAAARGDAARLRVRRAHGGRPAHAGREGERPHRAAVARAEELGDGRDHHVADRAAEPRLARARAHRTRAAPHPAVAAPRGAEHVHSHRRGDPRARAEAPPPREAHGRAAARGGGGAEARRRDASVRVDRAGRHQRHAGPARALSGFRRARRPAALKASPLERLIDRMKRLGDVEGIRIQGVDGLMVRYAQCCQPVPGDKVVGYVTRGRGVSIHRGDCPNLLFLAHEPERRLDIDWQESEGERFVIRLAIEASDRRGLYADLAQAVSETGNGHPVARTQDDGRSGEAPRSSRSRTSRTSRRSSRRRGA